MQGAFDHALADELETQAGRYAELVMSRVATDVPELVRDRELAEMAAVASRSLFTEFAVALRAGIDQERLHAPAATRAYVRDLARRGVSLARILRSYRLGQGVVFEETARLAAQLDDPDARMRALERGGTLSFHFVDSVMIDIADEYEHERELFIRGSYTRRQTIVRDLMAGAPVDLHEAERVLGRRLDASHLALVLWSSEDERADEQTLVAAARPLVGQLSEGRPLVLAEPTGAVAIWVTPAGVDVPVPTEVIAALRDAGAYAAVGRPGEGPKGFAATKRQADLGRSVALLRIGQHLTWYADAALAAVLLRDLDAARTFAEEELGELARPTRAAADLRATLGAYFAAGLDQSQAARDLFMHRNTVAKHLRRVEAMLGHPLSERLRELEAALVIADALSPAGPAAT